METETTDILRLAAVNCDYVLAASLNMSKRIGPTVYDVAVLIRSDTAETVEEKLLRLAKNGLYIEPSRDSMIVPQTGRLPERGPA